MKESLTALSFFAVTFITVGTLWPAISTIALGEGELRMRMVNPIYGDINKVDTYKPSQGGGRPIQTIETKVAKMATQLIALQNENRTLQNQVGLLKAHVIVLQQQSDALGQKLREVKTQLKTSEDNLGQKLGQVKTQLKTSEAKFSGHTHKLNLNFTTLPSLGCDKCNRTMPVLLYNKTTETTTGPANN